MFDLLMKRHGQQLLQDTGWPAHLEWQWQLSHSQGDGCAFYGSLSRDHLLTLLPHLARRQSLSDAETQHLTVLLTLYDTRELTVAQTWRYLLPSHSAVRVMEARYSISGE